jgi:hypothetical protein
MARAIVTGLEFYRYLDGHGDRRRAPKGAEVDLDDAELRRAIKEGWVTAVAGHEPADMPNRFQPPRGWSHRPSLWFVVPAWQRVELGRVCLGHLAKVCAKLTQGGIDASAVVVADDENLETARKFGFATIERGNMLGARLNDGYQAAAENGVEFAAPIGTDDLISPDLIASSLPVGDTVSAFRKSAVVSETGTQLAVLSLDYDGGDGIRIWPLRLLAPCGYRPAVEDMHRAIDTTTLDGAKRARPVVFVYHETDGLDIVDFKTDVQLNGYAGCLRDYGATKLGDPFDILAGRYPAATLKALRKFYGREAAA